jgi:polyisoprenoid-binding protein YceI
MPSYDAKDARCRVFTFKEGLLSAVAHDLEIDVTRFSVTVEGDTVTATFDPKSLRVLHAMHDGAPRAGALSDKDRAKIESNIEGDVLRVSRHPEIRFSAKASGSELDGTLTLAGRTRSLRVPFRTEGNRRVAEVTLHQPDFGIAPYSAMLGTLKIKPDVRVRIELPA